MATQHQPIVTSDRRSGRATTSRTGGIRQQRIVGGFVHVSTHQLALGWWLYHAGHITMRQFRVWLASFEMLERRRHMVLEGDRKPLYRVEEIQALVGGRGNERATAGLKSDLRVLARIGLVSITDHAIDHATSIEHIRLDDVSGFWSMYSQLPHRKRRVPIPRRTLRALAGGFSRAVTAVMLAMLIRSLFWQRGEKGSDGSYRVDGRTKLAWIANVFGISRRAVTDARSKLIELGWIAEVESTQWALNKWGVHNAIVPDWQPVVSDAAADAAIDTVPGMVTGAESGNDSSNVENTLAATFNTESASPSADFDSESASPCLNRSLFLSEKELNNRTLGAQPADPAGVSIETGKEKKASGERTVRRQREPGPGSRPRRSRRRSGRRSRASGTPTLDDIQSADLASNARLMVLYAQAVERGWIHDCEAGRLDFFGLAERARARGHNPASLFSWLLRQRRFDFITQADEDAAADRLRFMREGPRRTESTIPDGVGQGGRHAVGAAVADGDVSQPSPRLAAMPLTDDEIIVEKCLRAAKHLNVEAYLVAREGFQWSRDRYEQAEWDYQCRQRERWYGA